MAYVSRLSDVVRGGVMGADIQEGRAVSIGQSGIRAELPVLTLAATNEVNNVFCLMAAVDNFDRPTPAGMYTAPALRIRPNLANETWDESGTTAVTYYNVGKSVLRNPTLVSGEVAQAHRGGTYAVPAGAFIDTAGIRVPGALVRVGASGMWEVTSTASQAVGYVEEYQSLNGHLIFTLKQ